MIYSLYHAKHETLGLIADVLKNLSLTYKEINLFDGMGVSSQEKTKMSGLILMGGPMSVNDEDRFPFLREELRLIQDALKAEIPILGICLGSQLIAKALGSRVYPITSKEIGCHPVQFTSFAKEDPILKGIPTKTAVFHWHGETFDLPMGALHLAESDRCKNQAFRYGKNVYGFQFHLEVTPAMVQAWSHSREGEKEIQAAGENPATIIEIFGATFPTLQSQAQKIFSSYFWNFCSEPVIK